jgi:hypothetical protein
MSYASCVPCVLAELLSFSFGEGKCRELCPGPIYASFIRPEYITISVALPEPEPVLINIPADITSPHSPAPHCSTVTLQKINIDGYETTNVVIPTLPSANITAAVATKTFVSYTDEPEKKAPFAFAALLHILLGMFQNLREIYISPADFFKEYYELFSGYYIFLLLPLGVFLLFPVVALSIAVFCWLLAFSDDNNPASVYLDEAFCPQFSIWTTEGTPIDQVCFTNGQDASTFFAELELAKASNDRLTDEKTALHEELCTARKQLSDSETESKDKLAAVMHRIQELEAQVKEGDRIKKESQAQADSRKQDDKRQLKEKKALQEELSATRQQLSDSKVEHENKLKAATSRTQELESQVLEANKIKQESQSQATARKLNDDRRLEEKKTLQEQLDATNEKLSVSQEQKKANDRKIEELSGLLDAANEDKAKHKHRLEEKEALQEELDATLNKLSESQEQKMVDDGKIEELEALLHASQEKQRYLQASLEEVKKEKSEEEIPEIAKKNEEILELKRHLNTARQHIGQQHRERTQEKKVYEESLKAKKKELSDAQSKVTKEARVMLQLRHSVEAAKITIKKQDAKHSEETEALQQRATDAENKLSDAQAQKTIDDTQIKRLEYRLGAAEQTIREKDEQLAAEVQQESFHDYVSNPVQEGEMAVNDEQKRLDESLFGPDPLEEEPAHHQEMLNEDSLFGPDPVVDKAAQDQQMVAYPHVPDPNPAKAFRGYAPVVVKPYSLLGDFVPILSQPQTNVVDAHHGSVFIGGRDPRRNIERKSFQSSRNRRVHTRSLRNAMRKAGCERLGLKEEEPSKSPEDWKGQKRYIIWLKHQYIKKPGSFNRRRASICLGDSDSNLLELNGWSIAIRGGPVGYDPLDDGTASSKEQLDTERMSGKDFAEVADDYDRLKLNMRVPPNQQRGFSNKFYTVKGSAESGFGMTCGADSKASVTDILGIDNLRQHQVDMGRGEAVYDNISGPVDLARSTWSKKEVRMRYAQDLLDEFRADIAAVQAAEESSRETELRKLLQPIFSANAPLIVPGAATATAVPSTPPINLNFGAQTPVFGQNTQQQGTSQAGPPTAPAAMRNNLGRALGDQGGFGGVGGARGGRGFGGGYGGRLP